MKEHASSLFTWRGKVGIADASDLGPGWAEQIFDDACDVGFRVKSQKTGDTRVFILARTITAQNDLVEWVFEDTTGAFQIRVLND